jgi:hypothetical protein
MLSFTCAMQSYSRITRERDCCKADRGWKRPFKRGKAAGKRNVCGAYWCHGRRLEHSHSTI